MSQRLTRQLDIIPVAVLGEPITIIGAGAVGSWTAKALARMGFADIRVFDPDVVDMVNLNSQGYRLTDVGLPKVDALRIAILEETGTRIEAVQAKYEGGKFRGVVIGAVDNMEARAKIWSEHLLAFGVTGIIDARMGAEQIIVQVIRPGDPSDRENYPKSLYSDAQAMHEPCTAKATIYTAYLISGLIVKAVKDLVTAGNYLKRTEWNVAKNDALMFKKK